MSGRYALCNVTKWTDENTDTVKIVIIVFILVQNGRIYKKKQTGVTLTVQPCRHCHVDTTMITEVSKHELMKSNLKKADSYKDRS